MTTSYKGKVKLSRTESDNERRIKPTSNNAVDLDAAVDNESSEHAYSARFNLAARKQQSKGANWDTKSIRIVDDQGIAKPSDQVYTGMDPVKLEFPIPDSLYLAEIAGSDVKGKMVQMGLADPWIDWAKGKYGYTASPVYSGPQLDGVIQFNSIYAARLYPVGIRLDPKTDITEAGVIRGGTIFFIHGGRPEIAAIAVASSDGVKTPSNVIIKGVVSGGLCLMISDPNIIAEHKLIQYSKIRIDHGTLTAKIVPSETALLDVSDEVSENVIAHAEQTGLEKSTLRASAKFTSSKGG